MENLLIFLFYTLMAVILVGLVAGIWWMISKRAWALLWAVTFLFLFLLTIGVAGVVETQQPSITIQKADWNCTQAVKRSSTTYVQTGQVMNPITTTYDDCVQYTRVAK
jgi:hypothetical protein